LNFIAFENIHVKDKSAKILSTLQVIQVKADEQSCEIFN